jgi:hypothetical protein
MKTNVKFRVGSDEENQRVFEYIKEQSEKEDFSCDICLCIGKNQYLAHPHDSTRVVWSLWKGFRYFAFDEDKDLILCTDQKEYNLRPEKEICFKEFLEEKWMPEPKKEIEIDGVRYVRKR